MKLSEAAKNYFVCALLMLAAGIGLLLLGRKSAGICVLILAALSAVGGIVYHLNHKDDAVKKKETVEHPYVPEPLEESQQADEKKPEEKKEPEDQKQPEDKQTDKTGDEEKGVSGGKGRQEEKTHA